MAGTTTWRIDPGNNADSSTWQQTTLPNNVTWRIDNGTADSSRWPVIPATTQKQNTPPPVNQPTNNVPNTPNVQNTPNVPSFDQAAFDKQLNDLYQPSYSYLDQAESTLNQQYPSVLKDIEENYKVNAQTLADQKTSGVTNLDYQKNQAAVKNEDVLAATRRLYDQMRTGYQQRFGGSSSAGPAAFELANVEQQRQQGQTQRATNDVYSQIELKRGDIERGYSTGVLTLQKDKQAALSQAQRDFQAKLLEINQNRANIGQAKAAQSLAALQDLRNKVFAIQTADLQFRQNLALAKEKALSYVNNYATTTSDNSLVQNAFNSAMGSTAYNPASNLQVNNTQATNNPSQYIGQVTKKPEDYYSLFS